jgi:hypothetical protein
MCHYDHENPSSFRGVQTQEHKLNIAPSISNNKITKIKLKTELDPDAALQFVS